MATQAQALPHVCPTCNRRIPTKTTQDRKLTQDLDRAHRAIVALQFAHDWPGETESFRIAVRDEIARMKRALLDHALLWRIYRRKEKTTGYGISLVKDGAR